MDDKALLARWRSIWAEPVTGWDFSRFGDRLAGEGLPWSYDDLAREALRGARSCLDIGTGGGEVLSGLADVLPSETVATEGWAPNLPVADEALSSHGIKVVAYDAEKVPDLPFPDDCFDVVLARHEAYATDEVVRVLRPGGTFLTQQVDERNVPELKELFGGGPENVHVSLDNLRVEAEAAGLVVDHAEDFSGEMRVADVDTLVGYLAMVPWEVSDDFTVDRHAKVLLDLHSASRPIVVSERRFVLRTHLAGRWPA